MTVTIRNITDKTVTVDGNHELAGKTLVFDINVVDVREATDEELMPEVSGCGGSCNGGCGGCSGGCG